MDFLYAVLGAVCFNHFNLVFFNSFSISDINVIKIVYEEN